MDPNLRLSSMQLRVAYWVIQFILGTSINYAQYLPLDLNEAKFRVKYAPTKISIVDTSRYRLGSDISLVSQNGLSVFFVPTFNIAISGSISYYYQLFLTSNPYYGARIGSRYERSGNYTGSSKPGDISTLQSFFVGELGRARYRLGKFSPWEGQGRLSYNANRFQLPPIQGIDYNITFQRLKYTHGNYWLGYSSGDDDEEGLSRFYANQIIEYDGKYLDIEFGNQVIYAGVNQAFNWRYAVPLDPFIISIFNFGAPRNMDNHAIHVSLVYEFNDNLKILGKLIVDEFQIDATDRLIDDDEYGIQLSAILNIRNLFLQSVSLNHIRTTDYFGIHYGKSLNYEVQGLPILAEYGPQYERSEFIQNYSFSNDRIRGWVSLFLESKGKNMILGTPWQPKADPHEHENRTQVFGVETEVMYQIHRNIHCFISVNIDDANKHFFNISVIHSLKI